MAGAGDRLDRRALNRATLARQLLLGRHELPVTAADYLAWRPLLHPVLARSRQTFAQATGAGVDLAELAATAGALLAERWPGSDRVALAWSAPSWDARSAVIEEGGRLLAFAANDTLATTSGSPPRGR